MLLAHVGLFGDHPIGTCDDERHCAMIIEADFLARLRETPNDTTTRLVYADWLEGHGGPESAAKAELLRCLEQAPELQAKSRPRLAWLATRLDPAW